MSVKRYGDQSLAHGVNRGPSFAAISDQEVESTVAMRLGGVFGYDDLGRSVFHRCVVALGISLLVGFSAAAVAVTIGVGFGAVSGFSGGMVDTGMMRIVDILYGLPYILMVILFRTAFAEPLQQVMGGHAQLANVGLIVMAIGAVGWLTMARVTRGQVLSLKEQLFVEAARASGAGTIRILSRHFLPNLVGPIVVYATLLIPQAILWESFLSFLGVGVQPPLPSLGRLCAEGVEAVNLFTAFWWRLLFPCGILVVTLLSLNFVGDGLRDAIDPKTAKSIG
jgi:oligopeptide transport system permease protein